MEQTQTNPEIDAPQASLDIELKFLDPQKITVRKIGDELVMTVEDRSYLQVEVRRAFPLSRKNLYVTFFDMNEGEIGMLRDVRLMPMEMRQLVERELDQRYFTAHIRRVKSCKEEFGLFRLDVETDKGRREFYLRNLRDNILRLHPNRIILTDIYGNRFEIRDVGRLDPRSLAAIAQII